MPKPSLWIVLRILEPQVLQEVSLNSFKQLLMGITDRILQNTATFQPRADMCVI